MAAKAAASGDNPSSAIGSPSGRNSWNGVDAAATTSSTSTTTFSAPIAMFTRSINRIPSRCSANSAVISGRPSSTGSR